MLRITHAQTDAEQRWTLCGQLAGLWVAELRASWDHGRHASGAPHSVVDLSEVTFIDESGEQLLSEMQKRRRRSSLQQALKRNICSKI